jgi:hypothetical protein
MNWSPDLEPALKRAKQQIRDRYGDDPGISGIGTGVRVRGDEVVDEPVVVVGVVTKRPEGSMSSERLLPKTVEVDGHEWGVDVIETGHLSALAAPANAQRALIPVTPRMPAAPPTPLDIRDRVRPPRQGCSIANTATATAGIGTFGCVVRDLSDGTMCLLSCNHVIGRSNAGQPGELIQQPAGTGSRIGTLKRLAYIVPLLATNTDAAIAQLDDQLATDLVLRDLMAPISPEHQAIGMVVAGLPSGPTLLGKIGTALDRLGVELLGGSSARREAYPFMRIEKVGQTTGYTSSVVLSTDFFIRVNLRGEVGTVDFFDGILTWRFACAGDSGAIACAGGNGRTRADCGGGGGGGGGGCPVLGAAGDYYDLPLTGDNDLTNSVRDDVLSLSPTGRLLITAIYQNAERVITRLQNRQAMPLEISYAQQYYAEYRDFVAAVLADPTSTAVVTQDHLDDLAFITTGLTQTVLTAEETAAARTLQRMVQATLGMNRDQVIAHMNDPAVFQEVQASLAAIPGLDLTEEYEPL